MQSEASQYHKFRSLVLNRVRQRTIFFICESLKASVPHPSPAFPTRPQTNLKKLEENGAAFV